jgi:hypothetical protein
MNTSAAVAASALTAVAAVVQRVVKRRKMSREERDESANEQLLIGDGEIAAALRVYSASVEEEGSDLSGSGSGSGSGSDGDDDDGECDEEVDAGIVNVADDCKVEGQQ